MSKSGSMTGQVVISRLKRGDVAAFDMVYHTYCRRLYGFIFKIVKTDSDSEEIVQEVFLKIWESRETINELENFDNWIFTIAYNVTISTMRRKVLELKYLGYVKSLQAVDSADTTDNSDQSRLSEHISALIGRIPARQREVFLMHRFEGLSYREIAEKLNISANTVENHMAKALRFLRDHLAPDALPALFLISLITWPDGGV